MLVLDGVKLNQAYTNIDILNSAYQYYKLNESESMFSFEELLFLKNGSQVCASPEVRELYFSGRVSPAYLNYLRVDLLKNVQFKGRPVSEYKKDLDKIVSETSPHSVVDLCKRSTGAVSRGAGGERFGFYAIGKCASSLPDIAATADEKEPSGSTMKLRSKDDV